MAADTGADKIFSMRALVREVCVDSTLADPGLIADEVMRRIPKRAEREALAQVLRSFVRQVISEDRPDLSGARSAGQPPLPVTGSAKVACRRNWAILLRSRVCGDGGEWKLLGDCTYADLLHAAEERREQARRNNARARQYDALAGLLTEHDVERVRDLPESVLAAAFESGAAA